MAETSIEVVRRYLGDAIAAEKSFEAQLEAFASEGDNVAVKSAFHEHAIETKQQCERLTKRLETLGGSPSSTKGLLAHIFGLGLKTTQTGHEKQERTRQNLMMAFAIEKSEMAMYEALATIAEAAGDSTTASMAREIQAQEKVAADRIRELLPAAI